MAYVKHVYKTGDYLTADQINHIEEGIEQLSMQVEASGSTTVDRTLSSTSYNAIANAAVFAALAKKQDILASDGGTGGSITTIDGITIIDGGHIAS